MGRTENAVEGGHAFEAGLLRHLADGKAGVGEQLQHDHLYWEFHETDMLAVRRGDWKLVVRHGRPSLYHLGVDPHEDNDLADSRPDIVRLLVSKIYEDHTDNPLFPVTLPIRF